MNAPKSPSPHRGSSASERPGPYAHARLALRPPTFPPGPLNGAWWPRSDDLAAELTALTEVFDASRGRVTRIACHRGSWPTQPQALSVKGHSVTITWLASGLDPHTIRLFSYGAGRWDLLVIPPHSAAAVAARLMSAASDPALRLDGSALMAAESPPGT
ncbi:DUF5994 family protein [Streptomyces sp. NPDC102406]|uniref:DUF5994 family protein n=1 Tax=Streptomyces sp. NPDC102406 TaxID=3366171 RepID=UPI003819F29A